MPAMRDTDIKRLDFQNLHGAEMIRLHCPTCKDPLAQDEKPWVKCIRCGRKWLIRGMHATDERSGLSWCLHMSGNDVKGLLG